MSKIEVNTIGPQCGTTVTVGEGAGQTVAVDAATVNLGRSGGTVNLTCGATQSGFGRTGTVNWDTASIKTTGFTAVSGNGYFCDTADSGAFTLTLPSSPSAGDIVGMKDYNGNFATANLTIGRGGSKINGADGADVIINTAGATIFLVYVDATQGWLATQDDSSTFSGESFIIATGGTIACSGNYKYHTFTGPGTFTVCSIGSTAADNVVDYLVVAGGGGGGVSAASGGGAGGFRLSNDTCMSAPQTSPLANPTGITVTATGYPITIGAAGSAGSSPGNPGGTGGTSSFSTITSAGGGGGTGGSAAGNDGGSGSGGQSATSPSPTSGRLGGAGNTPPVSPPQGQPGGKGADGLVAFTASGGGGGAGAAGGDAGWCAPGRYGGPGGDGSYVVQTGFGGCNGTTGPVPGARYFAGGGGGSINDAPPGAGGTAGVGGGGTGGSPPSNPATTCSTAGGTNTGGGGGGDGPSTPTGKSGGSGIVILRYKFQ